jgi:hypothetical protein
MMFIIYDLLGSETLFCQEKERQQKTRATEKLTTLSFVIY